MTAKRLSLKERREQRRSAKRPRTREVPHPFHLPAINVTVKPQARQER